MKSRIGWYTLGAGILGAGLTAGTAACRADTDTSNATATGPGAGGGATTGVNVGGGATTGVNVGGSGGSGGGTGGSTCGDGADVHTIEEVNTDQVGAGIDVKLVGVVAMSQKFLVNYSKSSGSCLWGVFVSAPGLTETAANSGVIVKSYGDDAVIPPGGTEAACPNPPGDSIPDDVQPGDVLDIVGETSTFPTPSLLTMYCTNPGDTAIPGREVAFACSVTKTGTAPVPTPHTLAPDEITKLMDPSDDAFHAQWTGVKVRLADVTHAADPIVGDFGIITLAEGAVEVKDNIYYVKGATELCQTGPVFATPPVTWTHIDGFSYLDFCRWGIEPADKCADFAPSSDDCPSATACQ
jgi:hypothetical protein